MTLPLPMEPNDPLPAGDPILLTCKGCEELYPAPLDGDGNAYIAPATLSLLYTSTGERRFAPVCDKCIGNLL